MEDETGGFGSNGLGGVNDNIIAGLLVEIVLTFIFILTILGVTSKKANHGSFGGVVIGFTLVLVHLLGIGLTGTSVNPARSLFPAIFALAAEQNSTPLAQLWVFIVGPFAGAALAAVTHKFLEKEKLNFLLKVKSVQYAKYRTDFSIGYSFSLSFWLADSSARRIISTCSMRFPDIFMTRTFKPSLSKVSS